MKLAERMTLKKAENAVSKKDGAVERGRIVKIMYELIQKCLSTQKYPVNFHFITAVYNELYKGMKCEKALSGLMELNIKQDIPSLMRNLIDLVEEGN